MSAGCSNARRSRPSVPRQRHLSLRFLLRSFAEFPALPFGMSYPAPLEETAVTHDDRISRRRFAELGATAATGLGLAGLSGLTLDAQQGRGAGSAATPQQPTPRPEALK